MKKGKTIFICERCGKQKETKVLNLGPIQKTAPYPRDWSKIWKGLRVCDTCNLDFEEAWNKYLSGGIVSQETKVLEAQH